MLYSDVNRSPQELNARQALLCARLNLRGAKYLLKKGSQKRGMAALYDSVLFGMHYYLTRQGDCNDVDLRDSANAFYLLTLEGVFEDPQTFNRLSLTIERALWQGVESSKANLILVEVEKILAKLGVMTVQSSS
jgi:hypothetical protein